MSGIIKKYAATGLIRQPGGRTEWNEDGSISAHERFEVENYDEAIGLAPRRGITPHPAPAYSFLICSSVSLSRLTGGRGLFDVSYRGIQRGAIFIGMNSGRGQVEIVPTAIEDPIEAHPLFHTAAMAGGVQDLFLPAGARGDGSIRAGLNGAVFEDGKFIGWQAGSPFTRQEVYKMPTVSVRVSYASSRPPGSAMISRLGRIVDPRVPEAPRGGKRNYLLTAIPHRLEGRTWMITEEYLLSGPRGWNPVIYG
jgi:hypothetical protein